MHSAMYVGTIRHRRYFPNANHFRYPIYLMYLDLDELDQVFAGRWFYASRRRSIVEFRRSDFFGDPNQPLKAEIWRAVAKQTGAETPNGPVRVLTHLRHFGLSFNPVTFYYCYFPDGTTLHSIVAEITNTPWRERHAYVLPVADAKAHGDPNAPTWHWAFDKRFHVSPFLPMQMFYSWRFQTPSEQLRVHMNVYAPPTLTADQAAQINQSVQQQTNKLQFDTTLVLERQALNGVNLAWALLRFPAITLTVLWKIYWQALKIKWKNNPFYDHPGGIRP